MSGEDEAPRGVLTTVNVYLRRGDTLGLVFEGSLEEAVSAWQLALKEQSTFLQFVDGAVLTDDIQGIQLALDDEDGDDGEGEEPEEHPRSTIRPFRFNNHKKGG